MRHQSKYDTQYYISLFHQGDERGLNFVFHKLHKFVVWYAYERVNNWQIAEEIASEAFFKIWPHHHKLSQLAGIKAYLFKIVERDCTRAIQKEKSYRNIYNGTVHLEQEHDNVLHSRIKAETYHLLYEAIKKLSPGMRVVMESMYIEGNSLTKTAKILNLNISTVNTQKRRAIQAIKKLIPRLSVLFFVIYGIIGFRFYFFPFL